MKHSTRPVVVLDPHPDVIGHASLIDAITMGFDGRHYRRTGKQGHSLYDSTPVAEYSDDAGHRIWIDPLSRVHADSHDDAVRYRSMAIANGAQQSEAKPVHRVRHTRLKEGDVLYDAQGNAVDEVLYFTYGLQHSEWIVHTRAGYAYATQGGYLLGLSNEKPSL
ncbi:hypothetical protein AAB992_14065 [Burkholderia contaminans]|uniref:hypothetical protein n=1 Tax=Burkholderia contaminans TaxID=488447 RepID=UPI0024173D8F|nr:hypothetical protein [Burkholderia contaminans]WFN14401.1 hypothetical protein LXE92_36450 [Burkholderia contaminans]